MEVKNGLYSISIEMRDGKRGHATGVIVLCDGRILGGEPTGWRWRYTSDAVDSHAKESVKRDGVRQALSEIWHQ
jgi:hypothetical protein